MKNAEVHVGLSRQDWGQVIDGLQVRADSWRKTERYLNGEEVEGKIEECSDAGEARRLAAIYERIISVIEKATEAKKPPSR